MNSPHYTLAYYDRAGRVVKTVPPRGVSMDKARTRATAPVQHEMATLFVYSSLGQLTSKIGPDVGKTTYRYDNLGRLRFTIDAVQRQHLHARASYLKYDKLSRVTESGEMDVAGDLNALIGGLELNINDQSYPGTSIARKDVKRFYYGTSASTTSGWSAVAAEFSGIGQKFTRGQLSWTESIPDATSGKDAENVVRTFYSYDVHSNLAWQIHDIPVDASSTSDRLIKRTEYEYDHTLGAVRRVDYQRGEEDAFSHQYTVDATGSLVEVATSHDTVIWERDARYRYFDHGPLRRVVLGEDAVQGVDYTYTILGQLKGINAPSLTRETDPGRDGLSIGRTVRDAFGMSLSYYDGDYSRTFQNVASELNSGGSKVLAPAVNTYGGLIGSSTWTTQQHSDPQRDIVREGQLIGETYRYDVLGRLRSVTTHKDDQGTLVAEVAGGWSSAYKYDPHGNIIHLTRRAKSDEVSSDIIDDAKIFLATLGNVVNKIEDQYFLQPLPAYNANEVQAIVAGRSQVDEEGKTTNLSEASTESTNQFNSEDLPLSIVRKNASTTFLYDASGLVVRQDVVTNSDVTERFYLIPADATTDRAVYKRTYGGSPAITEWSIIGLGRIGVDRTLNARPVDDVNRRPVGSTYYELLDQVGSVRAVVSDVVDPDPNNQGRYIAQIVHASDYEAYGSRRLKRFVDLTQAYRYGWQGMRLLDGIDTRIDYITANRLYDVRVGRWLSPDPVFDPSASPYEGMASNPLSFTDVLGLQPGGGGADHTARNDQSETAGGSGGTMSADASATPAKNVTQLIAPAAELTLPPANLHWTYDHRQRYLLPLAYDYRLVAIGPDYLMRVPYNVLVSTINLIPLTINIALVVIKAAEQGHLISSLDVKVFLAIQTLKVLETSANYLSTTPTYQVALDALKPETFEFFGAFIGGAGGIGVATTVLKRAPFVARTLKVGVAASGGGRIAAGSLREFKSLVQQLSKPGSQLTKTELQQFEKLTEQFGGKLRYDLNPVKGKILQPHVQVEGLGTKVEGRKIWLGEDVK